MKLKALTFAIVALSFSSPSFAWTTDIPHNTNKAYAQDSNHQMVRDSWGRCVRTIYWTKALATADCEGWPVKKAAPVVAKPAPVIAKPAPVVEEVEVIEVPAPMAFRGFFKTNKAELSNDAKSQLDKYVDYLNKKPKANLEVKGYTDNRGAASYNLTLSQKRADAVKSYLETNGIAADRITAKGMGEATPAASNATKEGRAENRRVTVAIVY